MQVFLAGKPVTLTAAQLVAAGGQGTVYASGGWCYKVYHKSADALPAAKFAQLAKLDRPEIVRPEAVLTDRDGVPVGYTMRQVKNPQHVPPLFTRAFRDRARVTPSQVFSLVLKIRDVVAYAHERDALIVDLNELNWLTSRKLDAVWAIDVDSWQTPGFPAPVIMDTVRDRHARKSGKGWDWDAGTDWFSFAVLATQFLVGIHPYRGRHPDCHPPEPAARLDARMKANLSVFNPKTILPAPCFPVADVPPAYREWLVAVLEGGERTPAPATGDLPPATVRAASPRVTPAPAGESVKYHEVMRIPSRPDDDIVGLLAPQGVIHALTRKGRVYRQGGFGLPPEQVADLSTGSEFHGGFAGAEDVSLAAAPDGGVFVVWYDPRPGESVSTRIGSGEFDRRPGRPVVTADGRVYVQYRDTVCEQSLTLAGGRWLAGVQMAAGVVENAATLYPGVVVQQLLDSWYATMFPSPGRSHQFRLPGVNKVIDAKYDRQVLVVVTLDAASGRYDRVVYRFGAAHTACAARDVKGVDYAGIAFASLPKGVAVLVSEDETLEGFAICEPPTHALSSWACGRLDPSMCLSRRGDDVIVAERDAVLRVSVGR